MNITDIKCYAFWLGHRNVCLVKIETDEGIFGWGESGLSGREKAVAGAIEHFREFLVGRSAMNIGALWQEMYRSQYFEGGRVLAAAISAIDIALHDVLGKHLNVPVYQLLGGKQREYVELFVTATSAYEQALVEQVLSLKQAGWQVIRTTTGVHGSPEQATQFCPRTSLAQVSSLLTDIREQLGPETVLGIDYHHRLTVAETCSFIQRMPPGTLDFIEEPIRAQSLTSYQSLRQMVDVPFAIGEEFTSKWDFAPFVEQGAVDFARIDICNAGGFTEAMKIAALCETKYLDMMPHNPLSPLSTAASMHYCAAISNFSWLEWPPYDGDLSDYDQVFNRRLQPVNHRLSVDAAPGLGIEINEDVVKKLAFDFWEPPRLVKPDGSYQNW
ncbi:mandelate racemase/muconate lactonizing enzyme family protein [Thalassotalea litorea]|uniref:Mandelate racemase/muconate lactonizing enzyme family protein n=1 Tax=Thalassotalea litorea TaxID=2020715 RepID=A0A5R9ILI2_9GAMM|nr:mandelate racemase/muconate lactonizing enzyme family protein [Thalassotalea litorea]TLU66390.1 mandelate racemase/muconate lactonizing enzyme family protein [Thalassotalea litorea]